MHAGPRWSTLANIARHPRRSSPLAIDTEMYKWRHLIESFFCKLKEFKRIALRAGKTDQSPARAGAAQDRLDARRSGGGSGSLAPAGPARSGAVGRRGAARSRARLCGRDPGRPRCGAGDQRNGLSQAGASLLRGRAPIHSLVALAGLDHLAVRLPEQVVAEPERLIERTGSRIDASV